MNISIFTKENFQEVAKLFAQVFSSSPWNEPWTYSAAKDRFAQFINLSSFIGFAMFEQQTLIGFVGGFYEYWFDGKIFRIEELFVKEEFQGKGIGTMLIKYLEKELKAKNVVRSYLTTQEDKPAKEFYKSNSFIKEETIIMSKKI